MLFELAMSMGAVFYLLLVLCLISGSHIYELKCWREYTDVRYNGPGLQDAETNDTVGCIKKCREQDSCQVVNLEKFTTDNCYYEVNSSNVLTKKDLDKGTRSASYLYDLTCGEITRGVDLNCWDVGSRSYIKDFIQRDQKTLADCLSECKLNGDCWAVNWIVDTKPSCWIATGGIKDKKFEDSLQATNFVLSFDCLRNNAGLDLRFWKVAPDTKYASTGLLQVNKSDVQSCLNYCQNNENCTMVDFDQSTNPPCWAQTTKFSILRGKLVDNVKSYNYLLLRKEYEAYRAAVTGKGCWTKTVKPNQNVTTNVESRNFVHCLSLCHQKSDCNGVTWDSKTSKCFIQLELSYLNLDRECYKSVVGSAITYTTGVDTTCWIVTVGYNMEGLTGVDKQSVSECLEECLNNKDCRAVDWDRASDKKCFIQTNKNLDVSSKNFGKKSTVINHILDRECSAALFAVGKA